LNIRSLAEGLRHIIRPESATPASDTRYAAGYPLVDAYLEEVAGSRDHWGKPHDYAAGRAILCGERDLQVMVMHAALERMAALHGRGFKFDALTKLLSNLFLRQLQYNEDDLRHVLDALYRQGLVASLPVGVILRHVQQHVSEHGLSPEIRGLLERLSPSLSPYRASAEELKLATKLDEILGNVLPGTFEVGEPWADTARQALSEMDEATRSSWQVLLSHAATSDASRPSRKWVQEARMCIDAVTEERFKRHVGHWLTLASQQAPGPLFPRNSSLLKGLIWCCSLVEDQALCRALGSLGESCYRKIPGEGPRSERVGNACVFALGAMPGTEAIGQLTRLRLRVKYRAAQAAIQKALLAAAGRACLPPEELEERTVPRYGLDELGRLREPIGRFTAEIAVCGTYEIDWTWRAPDDRLQKSAPAEVRQNHAGELKELKQTVEEIRKMLPAQRDRIETLLRTERSWLLPIWRERYLEHPLLAALTRRLIWHFQRGDQRALGIWRAGQFVGAEDRPLDWLTDDTRTCLWHPIGFAPETVLQWRSWLEEHSVTQPFKQAHREVYILTDAELNTATYSNRFAAHILKQHQFKALCDQKGWQYRLQGGFDGGYEPCASLPLPQWELIAEFWVDAAGEADAYSDSGISLYVATDQVRFCGSDGAPRPLTEVPALLFTEVMRDVDLFVGVASVGNDPAWVDSGGNAGYRDYWQSYAFGDLSASAATRREVLARLLPRLKIASRCSLEGKFLVVRGEIRTYKIHLGSSNILMAPNDQYLCIVPDRSATKGSSDTLFLPFEGDRVLSLILSKAFLLAEDLKLKDATIVSQIRRR
jgi:Domain of unknown function (DUF4132)